MREKQLADSQNNRINAIKEDMALEMSSLFQKWDDEEKQFREKNPNAPRILDKHLREQVDAERKKSSKNKMYI